MPNPHSTAIIAGHPIHPMLIPFPIAFFVGTFVCDLIYWQTSSQAWAAATPWLLGAGLVMAALAAVMGVIDVFGDQQIRQLTTVWWHASANVLLVLVELLQSGFSRYQQGPAAIVPNGLLLSLISLCYCVQRVERRRSGIPWSRRRGRLTRDGSASGQRAMAKTFKVGDHVSWNSEAGRVRGKIVKVHRRDTSITKARSPCQPGRAAV